MKKTIALSMLTVLLTAIPLHGQTFNVDKNNRSIAITASANATAEADVATVHIGFFNYGPDSDTAYATGSRISNAIAKALADAGVKKDDMESDNQQVEPVQEYETTKWTSEQKKQQQFKLTQSWTVTVHADDAAKILGIAVRAGANQSGDIDWSVKDENALQAEAAGKALERAQQVAAQMAVELHIKLGVLIYASTEAPNVAQPMREMFMANAPEAAAAAPPPKPLAINSRKVEKSATVYAVFSIE
jgi:uncharacterized protein YggE